MTLADVQPDPTALVTRPGIVPVAIWFDDQGGGWSDLVIIVGELTDPDRQEIRLFVSLVLGDPIGDIASLFQALRDGEDVDVNLFHEPGHSILSVRATGTDDIVLLEDVHTAGHGARTKELSVLCSRSSLCAAMMDRMPWVETYTPPPSMEPSPYYANTLLGRLLGWLFLR